MLDPLQLFERLTAREFLATMGELRQMEPDVVRERTDELLDTLQLADDADRQIAGYSHGMRKKTALAAAVLHRPRLLLLDEPFEGVDPLSARTMRAMLDRFRAGGGTVVLSSHVMDLVERLCDHIGVIHRGRRRRHRADRRRCATAAASRTPSSTSSASRRPTPTRSPGWAERCARLVRTLRRLRWRLLRGAIRHGGAEQVGAVASLVASAVIGIGARSSAVRRRPHERPRRRALRDLLHRRS